MLMMHGEKESAKSTLENLIKMLADPSRSTMLTFHNDRSEVVQQLRHNYIVFYA
jgi:hypothetical protein